MPKAVMVRFALCLLALVCQPALADVPASRADLTYSFAPLVRQAAPAVVNIYATRQVQQQVGSPFANDPFFRQFFGQMPGGLPGSHMATRVQNSLGSGVVVRGDGLIVTNAHVIEGADEIRVVLNDRREFPAKVVLRDKHADLAVLRIDTDGEKLPSLELADSDKAEVGDLVLAIGNPFGVGQTVTNGIVSAIGRSGENLSEYNEFIQTDAPINPGNSGGALLDMHGHLLGVNAAIYSRDGGSLGIGFAIPANSVKVFVDAAETGRKPIRPWIGVNGQPVTPEIASSLGMKRPGGLLIDNVMTGSPAAKAGIRQSDVLLTLGDRDISDTPSLRTRLASLRADQPVPAIVFRDGEMVSMTVTPTAAPETPPRNATTLKGRIPFAGATIENLSPAVTEELGLANAPTGGGVVVSEIQANSNAARVGLQPGDIVLAIDGVVINEVQTMSEIVSGPGTRWRLSLRRGDQVINMTIQG